jgi:L-rhamnose mutarotase
MSDHFFVWKEILEKWNKGNISDYSAYQILNEEYINLTEV